MAAESPFTLTYATMFNPPEELHTHYDEALARFKRNLGQEYAMIIDGKDVFAAEKFENRNPANTDEVDQTEVKKLINDWQTNKKL